MRMKSLLILALLFAALNAGAVPPAYFGPLGNPEEPAMRPYKWLFSGLVSLIAQPVIAFKDGNLKVPVLGTSETVRGVRRGAIELDERIFRGLIFSPPPPRGSWKHLGYVNQGIDQNIALRYLTDFAATGYPWGLQENGFLGLDFIGNVIGAGKHTQTFIDEAQVWLGAQLVVDLLPMSDRAERELIEARAAETRKARMVRRVLSEPRMTMRERAQRMYIGERATINRRDPYTGRLITNR